MCQKKWNNTLQLHKSCKAFMESKTDEHKKCMFMWLLPLMIYVYEVIMTKKCLQMIMLCRLTAAVNCSRSDEHIFFFYHRNVKHFHVSCMFYPRTEHNPASLLCSKKVINQNKKPPQQKRNCDPNKKNSIVIQTPFDYDAWSFTPIYVINPNRVSFIA